MAHPCSQPAIDLVFLWPVITGTAMAHPCSQPAIDLVFLWPVITEGVWVWVLVGGCGVGRGV